jgi:hypothetical protein
LTETPNPEGAPPRFEHSYTNIPSRFYNPNPNKDTVSFGGSDYANLAPPYKGGVYNNLIMTWGNKWGSVKDSIDTTNTFVGDGNCRPASWSSGGNPYRTLNSNLSKETPGGDITQNDVNKCIQEGIGNKFSKGVIQINESNSPNNIIKTNKEVAPLIGVALRPVSGNNDHQFRCVMYYDYTGDLGKPTKVTGSTDRKCYSISDDSINAITPGLGQMNVPVD